MIGKLIGSLLKVVLYLAAIGELAEVTMLMREQAWKASHHGLISLKVLNRGLVGPTK